LQHPRNAKELKIFKLSDKFLSEIKSIQQKFLTDNIAVATKNFKYSLGFNFIQTLVFIGIEVFVVLQAIAKKITVGDIGFYTGVVVNYQNGLGGLFRNLNAIFESSLYVKSLFDLLDTPPAIVDIDNPTILDHKKTPMIEFKNVTFRYPDTKEYILKDFSLVINPGEKVAFVGENGAGKSTIIKLLARFYDVTEGEILMNGENIKNIDRDSLYKSMGVLFQDFIQYEHTAADNIYFGKVYEDYDLEKIIFAAKDSGAHQVIEKLEKGYQQTLGRVFAEGAELSVGQWQKVALARGFLRDAPILILDEPTASIDAKAESEIFEKVQKLSKQKTVIIISHRFSTVRNADKIYVLDNGKIKESGSHEDLMKQAGTYAKLFQLQAKGYQ
jgi:ATP-binding cassette, subfamily B, bacterial